HDLFIPSGTNDIVYQFHNDGTLVRNYTDPVTPGEGFGFALAASNSKLLVGAQLAVTSLDQFTSQQNGAAYVFDTTDGSYVASIANPTPTYTTDGDPDDPDAFGTWVSALPGGKFVVSDDKDNNAGGIDAGAAYVYTPNQPPTANVAAVAPVNENSTVTLDATGS